MLNAIHCHRPRPHLPKYLWFNWCNVAFKNSNWFWSYNENITLTSVQSSFNPITSCLTFTRPQYFLNVAVFTGRQKTSLNEKNSHPSISSISLFFKGKMTRCQDFITHFPASWFLFFLINKLKMLKQHVIYIHTFDMWNVYDFSRTIISKENKVGGSLDNLESRQEILFLKDNDSGRYKKCQGVAIGPPNKIIERESWAVFLAWKIQEPKPTSH